jgi:hypothetical protein
MIYFLQSTEGGPVKIGHSADVDTRRLQLESHYSQPLALLATMPGERDEERAIHERFAHLRLGRTEQFRPAADLMAFLGRPLLVDPNPDAVEAMSGRVVLAIIVLKGSPDYRDWLARFSEASRMPQSVLIDHALTRLAKEQGFEVPPKR